MGRKDVSYNIDNDRVSSYKTRESQRRKDRRISNLLLVLAVLCMLVAIFFLLIDPIKNKMREDAVDDVVSEMEQQIMVPDVTEFTFVVPKNANKINGEDYDVYGGDEIEKQARIAEMEAAFEDLPDEVTLTGLGIIEIDSIGCKDPVWDNDTVIDLRYGIGHHRTSVLPGQDGNCCLLGHHMRKEGVFFNKLIDVKIGDTVKITTVDGTEYIYIVDKTIVIDPSELENYVDADDGTGKQITLVSCTYTDAGTMRILVIGHILEGED